MKKEQGTTKRASEQRDEATKQKNKCRSELEIHIEKNRSKDPDDASPLRAAPERLFLFLFLCREGSLRPLSLVHDAEEDAGEKMHLLSPETPLLEFHARQAPRLLRPPSETSTTSEPRTLVVLASQHGDEPCGVLAVNKLLAEEQERRTTEGDDSPSSPSCPPPPPPPPPSPRPFGGGEESGGCAFDRVVFALGNPRAFARNARQVEENLNRCFPLERGLSEVVRDRSSYERRRAGELAPLLAGAAAVLDLHSASAPSPAFAMFPPSSRPSASLARALLGVPYAVSDHTGQGLGLAIEWAARHGTGGRGREGRGGGAGGSGGGGGGGGATAAVTLEAGQHASPSSVEASVRAIRAALRWRGGAGPEEEGGGGRGGGEEEDRRQGKGGAAAAAAEEEKKNPLLCRPTRVVVRKGEVVRRGFRWETERRTPPEAFTRFAFGELVASDDVKGELRCEVEGGARIVLPAARPVEGEDAFLWGEEEDEEEEEKNYCK